MGAVGCKEFFASLGSQASVHGRENDIADGYLAAALMLLNARRERVLLDVSRPFPRREEAHLTEVPFVGEVELGPEVENPTVKDDSAGIVPAVTVEEGKADVDNDAMERLVG